MSFSLSEYTKIDVGYRGLQRSHRPPSWFQGDRFATGREWRGGEGLKGGEEGTGGEREE